MEAKGTIMSSFVDEPTNKSFSHQQPPKSHFSNTTASLDSQPSSKPCFDCSICLDYAVDPVVTLCGHLYCWPCIYKWLQTDTPNHDCPVCKSPLSRNSLVPLYGRGVGNKNMTTVDRKGIEIPSRPVYSRNATQSRTMLHDRYYYPSQWGGTGVSNSMPGGVLGGLIIAVLPLVSRNSNQGGEQNFWRMNQVMMVRRSERERRVENSLHQIWTFLFCCSILWWLFF